MDWDRRPEVLSVPSTEQSRVHSRVTGDTNRETEGRAGAEPEVRRAGLARLSAPQWRNCMDVPCRLVLIPALTWEGRPGWGVSRLGAGHGAGSPCVGNGCGSLDGDSMTRRL